MKNPAVLALLFVFSFAPSTQSFAGDLLVFKREKGEAFFRLQLEPGRLKVEVSEDGKEPRSSMQYEKEKQEATMIDHKSKKYTVVDKATVDRMGSAMAKMQSAMSNLPPEMQKMMKDKMGIESGASAPSAPITLRKAGEGEKVGRWKATRYEAVRGKTVIGETWTVPLKEVGVDPAGFAVLKDLQELYSGLGKELKGMASGAAPIDLDGWKKLDGFPVKTLARSAKGASPAYVLESAEKKSFSDADFSIPSGYKKQSIPGM